MSSSLQVSRARGVGTDPLKSTVQVTCSKSRDFKLDSVSMAVGFTLSRRCEVLCMWDQA